MAGIYIHVPFCKQACHYCDFHFSTSLSQKSALVDALCLELINRKDYLGKEKINTIYFGGGTPSLLTTKELEQILDTIYSVYDTAVTETTIEVNPDDINAQKTLDLKTLGFNRLSIGIQSLDNDLLQFLNRAHTSNDALNSVRTAQKSGFENITIDLIYGIPNLTVHEWKRTLNAIDSLDIQHISAYSLTIEEQTVFGNWVRKGKLEEQDDELILEQLNIMISRLANSGFKRYEISNFAKEGYISKHNSNYWLDEKYLGIGPSAHSYNHSSRQWNIANNSLYIQKVSTSQPHYEVEVLDGKDKINEQLLTGLRTIWGVKLSSLSEEYKSNKAVELGTLTKEQFITIKDGVICLTEKGKLFADDVAAKLFL